MSIVPAGGRCRRLAQVVMVTAWTGAIAAPARAQAHVEPWSTVEIALSAAADLADGEVQRYWDPRAVLGAQAAFPFYWGFVEAGVHRSAFRSRGPEPDFSSWFAYGGWAADVRLIPQVRWRNGARIGIAALQFDESVAAGARSESELAWSLASALLVSPSPGWTVQLGVAYHEIVTEVPVRQLLVGAGVARRLGVPAWLRDFLD